MKHLLTVILVLAVLAAAVAGCGGAHRYDARLAAADSLMQTAPDSALAIVQAVCRDSLAGEGDRAYRALLLTQARYRNYITATSDSAINRALSWYRAHSGEREKFTRALIYKGAVMEELGHPDSAMLYYKQAEATADPDDYFNLGYSNLRIAELFQSYFDNDSAVVAKMKTANCYFKEIDDTDHMITTIGAQGAYPNIIGWDSARIYLENAIQLAKEFNSIKSIQYQSKLAGMYFYAKDYVKAKELSMEIFNKWKEDCNEQQFYYYAVRSYIRLNLIDSALQVLPMIPEPINIVDSMNHCLIMAEFAQVSHHHNDYVRYNDSANAINRRILRESISSGLSETELKWEADKQITTLQQHSRANLYLLSCILLMTLAIFFAAFRLLKKRIRNYQSELNDSRLELEKILQNYEKSIVEFEAEQDRNRMLLAQKNKELSELDKKNRELESKHADIAAQVSNIVRHRYLAMRELYQDIRIKSKRNRNVVTLFGLLNDLSNENSIIRLTPKESFWSNLKISVDGEFHGIASFVEQEYPVLTVKDNHLFLLMCAGVSNQIIKLCMGYTNDVTASKNKKKLIAKKMGLDIKLDEFIERYLQRFTG